MTPPLPVKALITGLLVAGLFIGPAVSQPATVPVPTLKEGDSWTYSIRDRFTGLELAVETGRVTAATPQGYSVEWTRPDFTRTADLTPELNARQVVDEVAGDTNELSFPLMVGKTWRSATLVKNRGTNSLVLWKLEREVVGFEKKKVAAGEFDTYKIVAKGQWVLKDDPGKVAITDFSGRLEQTAWYAPAVKRYVSVETRGFAKGHVANWTIHELTAYDLH